MLPRAPLQTSACPPQNAPDYGTLPTTTPPFPAQDTSGDGGRTASLRDVDGSLSGYRGATLLPNQPGVTQGYYSAPGCAAHNAFGLACPHKYVNLELGAWDWAAGGPPVRATLTRANLSPGAALDGQRLSLAGGELITKASRRGRYWNVAAAVKGVYLVSWGGGGGSVRPAIVLARARRLAVSLDGPVAVYLGRALPAVRPLRGGCIRTTTQSGRAPNPGHTAPAQRSNRSASTPAQHPTPKPPPNY